MMLESILGYKSTWRILSLLFETPRKLVSRQEIFTYTKLGNAPLSKALDRLVCAKILHKENKGKKEFYYVNQSHMYYETLYSLWEKERSLVRNLDYDIKNILSELSRVLLDIDSTISLYIFGSWAKGTASIESDVDIAIVSQKILSENLELSRIVSHIEGKFHRKVQIHTMNSLESTNLLAQEIKNTGIQFL